MRLVDVTWGSAIKVAWSIGWRLVLYLIPAYALAVGVMLAAWIAGDSVEGVLVWGVLVAYYLLEVLWAVAVVFAFVLAVKHVIGKSYLPSGFPPVREGFRIALIAEE